jgi:hypothetical protein
MAEIIASPCFRVNLVLIRGRTRTFRTRLSSLTRLQGHSAARIEKKNRKSYERVDRVKISTMLWQGAILLVLLSLPLALAWPGVPSGPFSYDEADYAYAASQGWFSNWIDRPALSLPQFVQLGMQARRDKGRRLELSQTIRQSGDIHFYRHWHGPLFFYWMDFLRHGTLEERQLRILSLLIPAIGTVVVYLGCLWVLPSSPVIAIVATAFYATGYSVVGSPELAPHQLFVVVSLANLFCLAKLEVSREQKWWWWACAWSAVSFATLEIAFVNVAVLLLYAWRCREILTSGRAFWLRSVGLWVVVAGLLWPAGLFKLEPVRSYIFMAYLALFRKEAWGNTTLLETWAVRFRSAPLQWILVVAAVVIWLYLPRKAEKYMALPFLVYGGLLLAVMFKVNGLAPRYVLLFLAPLAVFAGITIGAALRGLPKPGQLAIAGALILLVVVETRQYERSHPPSPNSRVQQILASLRARPLDGKRLLAPQEDVPVLHYYFPQINLAPYLDEESKTRLLSRGGIDAILSSDSEPIRLEYLGHN